MKKKEAMHIYNKAREFVKKEYPNYSPSDVSEIIHGLLCIEYGDWIADEIIEMVYQCEFESNN